MMIIIIIIIGRRSSRIIIIVVVITVSHGILRVYGLHYFVKVHCFSGGRYNKLLVANVAFSLLFSSSNEQNQSSIYAAAKLHTPPALLAKSVRHSNK